MADAMEKDDWEAVNLPTSKDSKTETPETKQTFDNAGNAAKTAEQRRLALAELEKKEERLALACLCFCFLVDFITFYWAYYNLATTDFYAVLILVIIIPIIAATGGRSFKEICYGLSALKIFVWFFFGVSMLIYALVKDHTSQTLQRVPSRPSLVAIKNIPDNMWLP